MPNIRLVATSPSGHNARKDVTVPKLFPEEIRFEKGRQDVFCLSVRFAISRSIDADTVHPPDPLSSSDLGADALRLIPEIRTGLTKRDGRCLTRIMDGVRFIPDAPRVSCLTQCPDQFRQVFRAHHGNAFLFGCVSPLVLRKTAGEEKRTVVDPFRAHFARGVRPCFINATDLVKHGVTQSMGSAGD